MADSVNIPTTPPPPGASGDDRKKFFFEHVARFCDRCGRPYSEKDVDILQQNDYSVVIHFNCPNCKARHLATFIKPLGITSRVLVNTDLTIDELPKFAGKRSISTDDLLDVHEAMKQPSFSLNDLF
jgi:hypothetical protein